jgi:hypothetical protein
MSVAGVHRRAMRRTYGVGHPVARAAAAGAIAAGAAGAGYYGGWGGGWGGWGFNRPLYASAALGTGGVWGGPSFGLGAAFCYPTFDYSTGWNQFCPGTGFAFGTGNNRPAQ